MGQREVRLVERLGRDGLARVLHDLLDHGRLVRLANSCGLRYPGMRTRTQKPERLLDDLVDRAWQDAPTRNAILRTLDRETAAASREWKRLPSPDKRATLDRLAAPTDGDADGLALNLLLAAVDPDPELEAGLARVLSRPDLRPGPGPAPDATELSRLARETGRLRKRLADLQKKLEHQEAQAARGREEHKTLKRDLITKKGELAESRMLVERLRKELEQARGAAQSAKSEASSAREQSSEKLSTAVRALTNEQRKLAHAIAKLGKERGEPETTAAIEQQLAPLAESVQALQRELQGVRRDRRKDAREGAQKLEELRGELRSLKSSVATGPKPARARRKGEAEHVGVFVDVQNMYYGARQLQGKLDFDALLQAAVRDRRLVQAHAYVVESKEIDQSGFITMLQQRAIDVRTKTLTVRADGSMKGDWDMEIALDILDAAPRLDVVVLVSGDGDFTALVNHLKRSGPVVEVIGWPRTTAKSLIEAADRFQPLDRKFMIRRRRVRGSAEKS